MLTRNLNCENKNDTICIRNYGRTLRAGFHTCVSRTRNGARCINITAHKQSQKSQIKAYVHVELLRGLCRDKLWLWPVGTDNEGHKNNFCPPKNRAKFKTSKCNNDFRSVAISNLNWMRYAFYISPNTKDVAINRPMVAYENRQNAINFVVANDETFNRNQA